MKHRIGFNRLGRRQAHRNAMKNNMVTSLFRYERVETTKAKALEVKRVAEKLVTRARVDSVHNRRIVGERIHDKEILAKLFTEIAPRYVERPGGYTRVLKTGFRQGDAAETVILELVDRKIEEKVRPKKSDEAAEPSEKSSSEETSTKAKETKSAGGSRRSGSAKAAKSESPAATEEPKGTEATEEPAKAEESTTEENEADAAVATSGDASDAAPTESDEASSEDVEKED